MKDEKVALTVNEASEYTGIGRNSLRTLISWEVLPVLRVGRKILIRKEVLDVFVSVNEGKNLKNRYEVIAV